MGPGSGSLRREPGPGPPRDYRPLTRVGPVGPGPRVRDPFAQGCPGLGRSKLLRQLVLFSLSSVQLCFFAPSHLNPPDSRPRLTSNFLLSNYLWVYLTLLPTICVRSQPSFRLANKRLPGAIVYPVCRIVSSSASRNGKGKMRGGVPSARGMHSPSRAPPRSENESSFLSGHKGHPLRYLSALVALVEARLAAIR